MKNTIILIALIWSFCASGQVVSGLYSGKLVNDSTKKFQTYELALSEYRGKITGYSYTTFVAHDTFYYSVKRVKGTIADGELIVEDEKMLANNFPVAPDKGVRQVNHIPLHGEDTLRQANGKWETTKTKNFYSIHGGVAMHQDNDSTHSPLIEHLKQLGVISMPHYQDETVAVVQKKESSAREPREREDRRKDEKHKEALTDNGVADRKVASHATNTAANKNSEGRTTAATGATSTAATSTVAAATTPPATPVAITLPYTERKARLMQTLDISSDSLSVAFFDNGVIDGDSISVYVNGKPVITNYKLLATASRKTIDLKGLGDDIQLLVVAENMGTIPPNTGLVTIQEGENYYQVNFTADLKTNALVILHRQKKTP